MNQRIILVQPVYPTSPFPGPKLPVGLGYLAEQLIKAGIEYIVVDLNINNFRYLKNKIISFNPDYLGISIMSLDVDSHYQLVSKIKKEFPSLKIIAGGPHVSFMKEEVLADCQDIDYGITHEGEESLIELIKSNSPTKIEGVIYRNAEKKIIYNGDRNYLENLDDYHFPTYKKFPLSKYGEKIDLSSSRGCPFNCTFCGAYFSMGKKWRARSPDSIIKEINFWYKKGYTVFNFVDSNFFLDKNRIVELCNKLIIKGLKVTISSDGMRATDADINMLTKMKELGLKSVAIGVESANDLILKNIKKGETISQIEKAIKICLQLKIKVVLFFIIGLPGETKKTIEQSFKFALKYPVSIVHFFNLNPLPKTEIYKWALENHYLLTSKNDMFANIGGMGDKPLIVTPELGYEDRKKLYQKGLLISKKVRNREADKNPLKAFYGKIKRLVLRTVSLFKSF